jgi:hypothetical protein
MNTLATLRRARIGLLPFVVLPLALDFKGEGGGIWQYLITGVTFAAAIGYLLSHPSMPAKTRLWRLSILALLAPVAGGIVTWLAYDLPFDRFARVAIPSWLLLLGVLIGARACVKGSPQRMANLVYWGCLISSIFTVFAGFLVTGASASEIRFQILSPVLLCLEAVLLHMIFVRRSYKRHHVVLLVASISLQVLSVTRSSIIAAFLLFVIAMWLGAPTFKRTTCGQASISAWRLARSQPKAPIHPTVHCARSCAVAPSGMSGGGAHRLIRATGGGGITAGALGGVAQALSSSRSEHASSEVVGLMADLRDGLDDEAVLRCGDHRVAQLGRALQVAVACGLVFHGGAILGARRSYPRCSRTSTPFQAAPASASSSMPATISFSSRLIPLDPDVGAALADRDDPIQLLVRPARAHVHPAAELVNELADLQLATSGASAWQISKGVPKAGALKSAAQPSTWSLRGWPPTSWFRRGLR